MSIHMTLVRGVMFQMTAQLFWMCPEAVGRRAPRTIVVQNDVSDRETVSYLSFDVVSHRETETFGR